MNRNIEEFLNAGRHFRAQHSHGNIMLIESDPMLKNIMLSWAQRGGVEIRNFDHIEEAMLNSSKGLKCVIVGLDGQDFHMVELFLREVDQRFSSIVTVVYSDDKEAVDRLHEIIPRITSVVKGSGLNDFLNTLDHEVVTEVIKA